MNSLSKLVAEKVLGWTLDTESMAWIKDNNVKYTDQFNPAESFGDCFYLIKYLAEERKLDVTIKYDAESKKHIVTLNYTNVSAEHADLCKAICIAAIQSIVLERELTPTYIE